MSEDYKIPPEDDTQTAGDPGVGWNEALGEHASNPPGPRKTGDKIFLYHKCPYCKGRSVECANCHGKGHTGEVRAEYTVSSCEARIKAQFEQWVRNRAKMAVDSEPNPEYAAKMREAYLTSFAAGHYSWDGRACRAAKQDAPGIRHLLYLLLRRCHPDMTEELSKVIFEDNMEGACEAVGWALGNDSSSEEQNGASEETKLRSMLTDQEWEDLMRSRGKGTGPKQVTKEEPPTLIRKEQRQQRR